MENFMTFESQVIEFNIFISNLSKDLRIECVTRIPEHTKKVTTQNVN